jgi:multidrug resistance protein MdtO
MATLAQTLPKSSAPLIWFRQFLRVELSPYPGRGALVSRMVIASTLIMIACMAGRIPYAFQGAIFALIVSRESHRATLRSGASIFIVTLIGAAYVIFSMALVIGSPVLHLMWVIGSLFLSFFVISAVTNYTAAASFAIVLAISIPLWDRHVSTETNVSNTLWICFVVLLSVVVSSSVEFAFTRSQRPGDEIISPIAERLSAIEEVVSCYANGCTVDPTTKGKIVRLEVQGTSILRRTLGRSEYGAQYIRQMGAVSALVSRLVHVTAILNNLSFEPSIIDRKRFHAVATSLAEIRRQLVNRGIPAPVDLTRNAEAAGTPLLTEIEHIVSLIPQVFVGSFSIDEYLTSAEDLPRPRLLASDAFVNPGHLRFALKGCLAASSCYLIYNLIAWPGISTAVTTCLLTALSTIGSSRQKQVLRIIGAVVGGFILGMGSQMFILPGLDSIASFTVLFIAVTGLSAWILTSSGRLSYCGLQIALAFYLVNLNEFKIQVTLAVARDRVIGIILGLSLMWLVFDQLWGVPAAREMKRAFVSSLRLLAEFAREPVSKDLRTTRTRSFALRDAISRNLDKVRSLGDGVLLEFGSSRQRDLALRTQILRWQGQLRVLFITQIASWRYAVQLPGFELPAPVEAAQREFDDHLAQALDAMAEKIEGHTSQVESSKNWIVPLKSVVQAYDREKPQDATAARLLAFLRLQQKIHSLTTSLSQQIQVSQS